MAGEKEIRNKIRSVKNMQKITKAMEMVAASKIRKAQAQMEASRPYAERIRRVVGHLAHANPDYKHPFLVEREIKRVGYIVISTDRGLCGGLNVNMFKSVIGEHVSGGSEGVEADLSWSARRRCSSSGGSAATSSVRRPISATGRTSTT